MGQSVLKPIEHRRRIRSKSLSDFPGVSKAHLEIARKLSSPLLSGPPLCDELVSFVQHLFTEEEAGLVQHLGQFTGMTAADLAKAEHRPVDEVEPILHRLAVVRRSILASRPPGRIRYRLMPIMPGIFETVMIGESPDTLSPWHRRFAELFEALYDTGYLADYKEAQNRPVPALRWIPARSTIEAHPMALPSDYIEPLLDRFSVFGLGQCQCRLSMRAARQGCGKPVSNCTVMGRFAERGIKQGWLRPVTRKDVLEIKREAESHGLVTWIMNTESTLGQMSCSCCGCCCHAMRIVSEFSAPGIMAPAHFLPRFDSSRCIHCGKCARNCPMGALAVDGQARKREHFAARCIGCGLCVVACGDRRAVSMEPVPEYRLPYKSWFALQFRASVGLIQSAWKVWRQRP